MHVMCIYHKWTMAGQPTITGAHQHAKTLTYINDNQKNKYVYVCFDYVYDMVWGFLLSFDNVAEHIQSKGALLWGDKGHLHKFA